MLQDFLLLLRLDLGATESINIRIGNERQQRLFTAAQDPTKIKETELFLFSSPIIRF